MKIFSFPYYLQDINKVYNLLLLLKLTLLSGYTAVS